MKTIKLIVVGGVSFFLVACGGGGWSDSQRSGLFDDCMEEYGSTESMCNCQVDIVISEFTYEEYTDFESMDPEDVPEDAVERMEGLMSDMMECVPDGSIDLR